MVFTLIFNEFGIDLEGETSKRLLHTDHYTEMSLHRMGYIKKDNQWVKKATGQREMDSDSDIPDQEAEEDDGDEAADEDGADDDEDDDLDASAPAEVELSTGSAHRIQGEAEGPSTIPETGTPRTPQAAPVTRDSSSHGSTSTLTAQLF